MADKSKIEWTDATWNPLRGCDKVSPGCKHCYAEVFAERFRGVPGHPYEQGFDLRLVPEKLDEPMRWARPRRIFTNSMSDLFHVGAPREYIAAVFGVMAMTPRHTFQVLTKRAAELEHFHNVWLLRRAEEQAAVGFSPSPVDARVRYCIAQAALHMGRELYMPPLSAPSWPLPNVWQGVSVEDKRYGVPRIQHLKATPAAVRFLSVEPLLEDLGEVDFTGMDQVIIGGESGAGARAFHVEWARSLIRQAQAVGSAVFVKQMGASPKEYGPDGIARPLGFHAQHAPQGTITAKKGQDMQEWPEDIRIQQWPAPKPGRPA